MSMALVESVPVRCGLAPKLSAAWPVPLTSSNCTAGVLEQDIRGAARCLPGEREGLVDVAGRQRRAGGGGELAQVRRGDGERCQRR